MRYPSLASLLGFISVLPVLGEVPPTLSLRDGVVLEKVTELSSDGEKVKVTHGGGVSRHLPAEFTPESQEAMGIPVTEIGVAEVMLIDRIETTKGKVYEKVSALKVKPSHISFVHRDGAASVRFEVLPEAIRIKCGYNPAAAELYDRERAENEAAMAKAEAELARAQYKAKLSEAMMQRRRQTIDMLRFTTIGGTRYWTQEPRSRELYDAIAYRHLLEGGYSEQEADVLLWQLKFR